MVRADDEEPQPCCCGSWRPKLLLEPGAGFLLKVSTQTALDRHVSWRGRACLAKQGLSLLFQSPLIIATALRALQTGAGREGGTSSPLLGSLASCFLS